MDYSLIQLMQEVLEKTVDEKKSSLDAVIYDVENEKASVEVLYYQRACADKRFFAALLDWAKKLKTMGTARSFC